MHETRDVVLKVAKGDADAKPAVCDVAFCESSASLCFGSVTVHIPWTELAVWQAWLAERVQKEAD